MRRQKVPRKSLDDAPKSSIFQAYGWRQPEKHISAKDQIKDELNEMRGYLKSNMMKRVERLVENYVSRYLDFNYETKILIATASFGELDSSILDKLQDSYEHI